MTCGMHKLGEGDNTTRWAVGVVLQFGMMSQNNKTTHRNIIVHTRHRTVITAATLAEVIT